MQPHPGKIIPAHPKKLAAPKHQLFDVGQLQDLIAYRRNATRHRQSENDHSRTCRINLVNFGSHTEKNKTGGSNHPKSTFIFEHSHLVCDAPENFTKMAKDASAGDGFFYRLKYEIRPKNSVYFCLDHRG